VCVDLQDETVVATAAVE